MTSIANCTLTKDNTDTKVVNPRMVKFFDRIAERTMTMLVNEKYEMRK